jgi:Cof subfamily protein (haloacid dehalogenase superfamily)
VTTLLLASDLDGTLLRSDGTVAPETRAALARARDSDLLVAFVTGRPPRWLHEVAEQTGHYGVAIGANGAVVYDLAEETVIDTDPLSSATVASVTAALREAFPSIAFGFEYGLEFGHEREYRHDWEITPVADRLGRTMPQPVVAALDDLVDRPVLKILAKWRAAPDAQQFMVDAVDLLGDTATVTRSSRGPLLEISAPGVDKSTGLAHLAVRRGIGSDQVAAVGDMPNDLAMLDWAGRGYAVANAHPDVRAVADEVLPETNDEHAVAVLIDRLIARIENPLPR